MRERALRAVDDPLERKVKWLIIAPVATTFGKEGLQFRVAWPGGSGG